VAVVVAVLLEYITPLVVLVVLALLSLITQLKYIIMIFNTKEETNGNN
jgi:positive regulator of sigma E activity